MSKKLIIDICEDYTPDSCNFVPAVDTTEYAIIASTVYDVDSGDTMLYVVTGRANISDTVTEFKTEIDLIAHLIPLLFDQGNTLFSYHGSCYDVPYLVNRANKLGVSQAQLVGYTKKEHSVINRFIQYQVAGVEHIDMLELVAKRYPSYTSLSLPAVCDMIGVVYDTCSGGFIHRDLSVQEIRHLAEGRINLLVDIYNKLQPTN